MIECWLYSNKGSDGIASILGNDFPHLEFREMGFKTCVEVQQKYGMRYTPQTRSRASVQDENELGLIGRRFYDAAFNLTVVSGSEVVLEIVRRNGAKLKLR